MEFHWGREEEMEEWMAQARITLRAAEEMLLGDLPGESIADSFLAMLYAARAVLSGRSEVFGTWEDVVGVFRRASSALGLSAENRRALPIVAELYRRVFLAGDMEADPLTASACLDDARAFVAEMERLLEDTRRRDGGGTSLREDEER